MITVTPQAAEQIRKAAQQSNTLGMPLRLAGKKNDDGSIEYGMGFDERREDDHVITSEGVDILISPQYADLLVGATLDFVEINPGDFRFIFSNPNDDSHRPAGAGQETQE